MANLFIICGHGAGDCGACGYGYTEEERVRALAARMVALGGDAVILGDTSRNWYEDNGISNGDCPSGVPVIELHMDSASESARGGHVIISSRFDPDDYDNALASFISTMFPGRSTIIAQRSDLANPNRAAVMGVNYRLLECCFISNESDLNKFNTQMDELATGILAAFGIGVSTNAPAETTEPTVSEPDPEPVADTTSDDSDFHGGLYRVNCAALNVRSEPSTNSAVVATYVRDQTVELDDWYEINEGLVWAKYTGYSGYTRYIAVGPATGQAEADDYLVKA